jgi:phosphomannomutase/phosphoglucomutase
MAEILRKAGASLSGLAGGIPQTLITPDLRFFCPYDERDHLLKDLEIKAGAYPLSKMDGLRIEFAGGWLLLRKSVTEEGMTLRAEAQDAAGMEQILSMAAEWIPGASQIIETYLGEKHED